MDSLPNAVNLSVLNSEIQSDHLQTSTLPPSPPHPTPGQEMFLRANQ